MKKTHIINLMSIKKLGVFFAGIALSLLTLLLAGSSVFAGGPANRPTFTSANPADHVVFNAITDNPVYGDERNFVLIREAGQGAYQNEIKLQPGKEYEVRTYFHNNAKSSLNTGEGTGIARNARISTDVPSAVKPGERGRITSTLSASNANPQQVWDEAYITADSTVSLRYVPGSAVVRSNGAINGQVLPSSLFTPEGTFLGYSALNGALPGCADFAGYVTYRLAVDQPAFEVTKEVAPTGSTTWSKQTKSALSGKVDFRVTYKNTGTTNQENVTIKDTLPKGLTYVKGSTKLVNQSNPSGKVLSDNITTDGVNIGNYGPNATATITFSATVASAKQDFVCGDNKLTNTVSAITGNGTKVSNADVIVTVECQPGECKPGIPEGDERCNPEPCVPGDGEVVDKNGNCVPAALPTTGPAQIIAGILGVALVTLGVAYWIRSRKSYKKALSGFTEDANEEPTEHLLEPRDDHNHHDGHADNFHNRTHR